MSKCGKGCMPECEYFTTSGCISPFNCMYRIEELSPNSATSVSSSYVQNLISENAVLKAENARLTAENAELKARLERAVEPEFTKGDKAYAIMDTLFFTDVFPVEIKSVDIVYEVFDGEQITTQHCTRIFTDRAAAEARLAELKGDGE